MPPHVPTAGRRARPAVAGVLAAVLVVLLGGGAGAAGTGGIEVTPVPEDSRSANAFVVDADAGEVGFFLRNVVTEQRSARLYAADATEQDGGGFSIGGPGSSELIQLDEQEVTLQAGEVRRMSFELAEPDRDQEGTRWAAVVIEVEQGSVVQRAATLVQIEPASGLPLPLLLVLLAVALLVVAGVAVGAVARRRRA